MIGYNSPNHKIPICDFRSVRSIFFLLVPIETFKSQTKTYDLALAIRKKKKKLIEILNNLRI